MPLSESLIEMARLSPERSVRLLGFLDAADVSPDLFLGVRMLFTICLFDASSNLQSVDTEKKQIKYLI